MRENSEPKLMAKSQKTDKSNLVFPRVSVLGPLLYLLHTSDLPTSPNTETGTFGNDTMILASHKDPVTASAYLQEHLINIQDWIQ